MAEVETNTIVKGIIAIIVLLVMALVIYSLMNFDEVKTVAQEVFHIDTQEEINTKTEDTVSEFSSDLDACAKGDYNPNNKDSCFCFQKTHGIIQEGSYISISNSGSSSQFTTLSENDAPISQFTKNYNLGLMATSYSGSEYQLGCVFPTQFFIIAKDKDVSPWYSFEEIPDNQWSVKWIDSRLEFFFSTDYTFGFYRDDKSSSLRITPMLYRLDSTHYCLVTKLIDEPVDYSASEFIPFDSEMQAAPALMRISDYQMDSTVTYDSQDIPETGCNPTTNEDCYYSAVQEFLLNEELYCNKL
ncbi:hypothetical protein J4477_00575 [Candidatus Pacearchaeota archaeon]|nr:hypothetical protein [Candidatus Pacearchaeota archaeon]